MELRILRREFSRYFSIIKRLLEVYSDVHPAFDQNTN